MTVVKRSPYFERKVRRLQIDTSVMYLTPKDIAAACGIDRSTICQDIEDGKLKAIRKPQHRSPHKLGRRLYIHPDDFATYYRNPEYT